MVGLERGTVSLKPHDPGWRRVYESEVERLRSIPAVDDRVLAFEHVGSTAVADLAAKPIVDVLALIECETDADGLLPVLESHGYEHRPNDAVPDRVFLANGPRSNRTHYLSLTEQGSDTHLEQVAFRDVLREQPSVAAAYERLKRTLAERYADDRVTYTAEKGAFVERVLERETSEGTLEEW